MIKEAEFATMLRTHPLFGDLPPAVVAQLARLCSSRRVEKGAALFQRGDPGDAMYGVRRGRIAIEISSESGQHLTLAMLGSGDVFGEIALLDGKGRTADATAIEDGELFVLRRADLLAHLAGEPQVAIKLIEILCRRLRSMSDQVESSMTAKLEVRLAHQLASLSEDYGEAIDITQEQLARMVGATRESVNRQLRAWERAGWIAIERGRILIKKVEGLKTAAG